MSCEDIPSLLDLQKVKKHADDFGRLMGTDEGYSTNEVTGQVRPTYNKVMKSVGFKPGSGDFTTGFTVTPGERDIAWYDPVSHNWYSYLGVIPSSGYDILPGTNPVSDSNWKPVTDQLLRIDLSGDWPAPLNLSIVDPVGVGDYRIQYNRAEGSLHSGVRDPLPLDDGKAHFRGLPNKDTWADPAMQGIGSFATGRNGASFAYLSATFGHDCVVYGAAGLAGGAGSCAGNPDSPFEDAAFGYCSLAYGKNTLAMGRTSNAMGQDCEARSLVSSVDGYASYAAPGLASHPNAYFPGAVDKGVVSEGKSARAYGWRCEAYGNHATSIGSNLKAYNGATAIGSSPNDATPAIVSVPGAVALFSQSTIPGVVVIPEDGTKAKTGFNTVIPRERFESVINPGEKFVVRKTGTTGNGRFALQGTLIGDTAVDILSIEWNNPSPTVANGVAIISINGIASMEITPTGVVNFLVGSLALSQPGQGVKLTSPNGTITKIMRLNNAGAIELV